jgi:hypothetical protein
VNSLYAMIASLPREIDFGTTLALMDDVAVVTFGSQRTQKIRLRARDDHYIFSSRVLGRRRAEHYSWDTLARLVWPRNRRTPLVTFMLDERSRLIGRIEHPRVTLNPPELRAILLHLARECDRLEYLLTGRDEH